jgi:ABC-type amino acid transport substrate-binding protein
VRRAVLLIALAAIAALPAAAGAQEAPPTASPGVLTVGLNMASDALQVGAASGSRVVIARGLEIDLARAIARGLGVRAAFVQEPRFTRLLAPGTKPWDVALAQVTIVSRRIAPASAPTLCADEARMLQALQAGRCDAVVLDAPILASLRAQVPERYGPFAGVIRTGERHGVVLPKGSALVPRVDAVLAAIRADGRLAAIVRRWLTTDLASLPVLS